MNSRNNSIKIFSKGIDDVITGFFHLTAYAPMTSKTQAVFVQGNEHFIVGMNRCQSFKALVTTNFITNNDYATWLQ